MHTPRPRGTSLRTLLAGGLVVILASLGQGSSPPPDAGDPELQLAASGNPTTPRNFTGYGFDQCEAPSQTKMDAWRLHSPFWAVGIYISGDSRGCRAQTNLTPGWVATQLARGWRLLPITLGPQASCHPDFPRYGDDRTISPNASDDYQRARNQGWTEGIHAMDAARALGIPPGSTLFYDLEAASGLTSGHCRESALRFVDGWTKALRRNGFVSGFYSSAGSGIKMLDDARVSRPGAFALPEYLWIARWDGQANTTIDDQYLRADGWTPHRRIKQYRGGHTETWGGETINIDSNYLDVGHGSRAAPETHCGGVTVDFTRYRNLKPGTGRKWQVRALQCLLHEEGYWQGGLRGWYGRALTNAVHNWQRDHGFAPTSLWSRAHWVSLTAQGPWTLVKYGSAGPAVFRLQRSLNANGHGLTISGVFEASTRDALRAWQRKVGVPASGNATRNVWWRLTLGK